MSLSLQELKDTVSEDYYNRGVHYFSTKKVIDVTVNEDNLSIIYLHGITKSSSSANYFQNIEIISKKKNTIIGNCTCPVNYNCKHIVAICLEYITNYKKINTKIAYKAKYTALELWLKKLENNNEVSIKEKSDYFLTYRLFCTTSYHKDELLFYKSKILKNGKISQGTALDSYKVVNEYYDEFSSLKDKDIIKLSKGLYGDYRYNRGDSKLEGTLGYMIVELLLKTKRCYFDDFKNPLEFDTSIFKSTFKLSLYNGKYTIKSNIIKKDYRLLDTIPPLIIDITRNIIQKIDIDIKKYKQLLDAPQIEKDDIKKVYGAIKQYIPNIKLQTPTVIKTKQIDTKPIVQLHINGTILKVNFSYDLNIVSYFPRDERLSFYENGVNLDIKRDLDFENSAKNKIEKFGFDIEYFQDDITVILKDKNRQEQLSIWKEFLNIGIPNLQEDGWEVNYANEECIKFEEDSNIVVKSENKNDWFSLSFDLEFNGVTQAITPLVASIIEEFDDFSNMPNIINIEVSKNQFVEVQTKQIEPIIQTIIELLDKKDKNDNIIIAPYDAHLIGDIDKGIIWQGKKEILELSSKLKDFNGIENIIPPKVLNATLREYQQDGLNWLNFLYEFKFNGILADDMGLGKTIQTLTHLSKLKEDGKLTSPSLIVMPTSLIANWKNEIKKFTPNLSCLILHGSNRFDSFDKVDKYDVVLSTYPLIVRDKDIFNKKDFFYIILDEAQKIKNANTKMTKTIKTFKSKYKLALSGTPIENHIGELWSIFSFLMPGFLDSYSFFKNYYQNPIEIENNINRQQLLNKKIKPFILRRTKEIVATELPAKSIIVKYTQFDKKQSKLYESIRVTMEKKVQEAVKSKGLGSSHITILDALLKLRQVCCDPSLVKIDEVKKIQESAKLELLLDLLDELLSEGRKILLFSQFTSMLKIIEDKIIERNISYCKLTGSTRNREDVIEKFTSGNADIFLISLKAGGVGLNLTQADTVIHYDPWWNPAVENQATDRAYRIGQDKKVFVYKLIVENTIEEKILEMQKTKQSLQDGIYNKDGQKDDIKFSGDELLELLK